MSRPESGDVVDTTPIVVEPGVPSPALTQQATVGQLMSGVSVMRRPDGRMVFEGKATLLKQTMDRSGNVEGGTGLTLSALPFKDQEKPNVSGIRGMVGPARRLDEGRGESHSL